MTGYSTGTANQLSSDGTYDFTYDDEGNMTEKENSSTTETWLYGYNHLNQLTQIQHKTTSAGSVDEQVDFTYDVFGNRTERSYDADGAGAGTATVEKFAYDLMGNAWADLDSGGSLTTRRLFENAVDALFARVDSGGADWYLTDRLGSVRDIMNNSSSSIYHADYDGYGNITSETNPSNGDRYKYTSREWEAEFELQYNRARYYDPSIGRWISQDPIGFDAGDSNLYRYVNNRPTMATDPSGLQYIRQIENRNNPNWEGWKSKNGVTGGNLGTAHGTYPPLSKNPMGADVGNPEALPSPYQLWEKRQPLDGPPTKTWNNLDELYYSRGPAPSPAISGYTPEEYERRMWETQRLQFWDDLYNAGGPQICITAWGGFTGWPGLGPKSQNRPFRSDMAWGAPLRPLINNPIPNRTAIINLANSYRGLSNSQRPAAVARLVLRNGSIVLSRSTSGNPVHRVISNYYGNSSAHTNNLQCAEIDAISQVLRHFEATTRIEITTFQQARRILQGSRIQTARVRPATGNRAAEHGTSIPPCTNGCDLLLQDLGIIFD